MRAVVYSGYGTMPELAQVADPACPPDGVVITVGASGVCRSDWHAWKVVAVPDAVDFVAAACLGCRFATAFRAVTAHGRIRAGDWLAVHGCGGVGLSAVMIGAALGARVVAVDVSASALSRARELGASFTVDASLAEHDR